MPNWCYNELEVSGSKEQIQEFYDSVVGEDGTVSSILNTFVPIPEEMTEERDGYRVFTDEGYEFTLRTWGTKWPDSDTEVIEHSSDNILFTFSTPWSPPIPAFMQISKFFPELKFTISYEDEGLAFLGEIVIRNNKIVKEHYREDWYLDYELMENAGLTESEIESAQEYFHEYYDAAYNWRRSAKVITKDIIKIIKAQRDA